jgi:hypothetical protein
MRHLKNRYLILIILFLVVAAIALQSSNQSKNAFAPLPISPKEQATFPSPIPEPPACIDEKIISDVLNSTYHLQKEQFLGQISLLECTYRSEHTIQNLQPELHYVLIFNQKDAQERWEEQQAEVTSSSQYRRIEENKNLFALVNSVKEISQVYFYGYKDQKNLQLDYTPIKEDVGTELEKGRKVAEMLLEK